MTGPELATLSTIGWVVVTLTLLVVVGTWSAGESWSILPGLVRGVRDWAGGQVASRQPSSPDPWAAGLPLVDHEPPAPTATSHGAAAEPTWGQPHGAVAEVEELTHRRLR